MINPALIARLRWKENQLIFKWYFFPSVGLFIFPHFPYFFEIEIHRILARNKRDVLVVNGDLKYNHFQVI